MEADASNVNEKIFHSLGKFRFLQRFEKVEILGNLWQQFKQIPKQVNHS
jgi:hypothetical protein